MLILVLTAPIARGVYSAALMHTEERELPDRIRAGAAIQAGKTLVGVEISRAKYEDAFGPPSSAETAAAAR